MDGASKFCEFVDVQIFIANIQLEIIIVNIVHKMSSIIGATDFWVQCLEESAFNWIFGGWGHRKADWLNLELDRAQNEKERKEWKMLI